MNILVRSFSIAALSIFCGVAIAHPSLTDFFVQCSGAGVLPCFTDKAGKLTFILTREVGGHDKGTFDGFSGSKDPGEDHPNITAWREWQEESMGLFPEAFSKNAQNYLDVQAGYTQCVIVNTHKKGITYITQVSHIDVTYFKNNFYRKLHTLRAQHAPFHLREKDEFAFVYAHNLERAIAHAQRDANGKLNPLTVKAKVFKVNTHGNTYHSIEDITVRPCLVSMTQPYFQGKTYTEGKHSKIRFY